jgi:hypothetical protein
VSLVITPNAQERFTPHELIAAYVHFLEHGPQYLNAETGLSAAAYRLGERMLIVSEEPETGVVTLATVEGPSAAQESGKVP